VSELVILALAAVWFAAVVWWLGMPSAPPAPPVSQSYRDWRWCGGRDAP
jgi:hypothetical protein